MPPENSRVADLCASIAQDPTRRSYRIELASLLLELGDASGALDQVRATLQRFPGDTEALGIGAMAADLLGDSLAADTYAGAIRMANDQAREAQTSHDVQTIVPLLNLADVDGCFEEKRRIDQVLLKPYRQRRNLPDGMRMPRGLLLYGPSGSSKGHLARAVAGELHLMLIELDLAKIADPWGAPAPGAITEAFRIATENAPALVFLDNVDRTTHRRLRYLPHGREPLQELESALRDRDPSKILVIGSTAAPWFITPALRQHDSFDRLALCGPPDLASRAATIERTLLARGIPYDADLQAVAAMAEGCTHEDLVTMVAFATQHAFVNYGANGSQPVREHHFRRALLGQQRSGTLWFDTAYNFPEFMDESTQFDPLFDYIRRHVRRPMM